jgi:hypothetical protein
MSLSSFAVRRKQTLVCLGMWALYKGRWTLVRAVYAAMEAEGLACE